MLKRTFLLISIILLISGIIITGCSKSTSTTSTPTPTTPVATSTPGVLQPQYGGTLRIISGAEVNCLGWVPEQMSQSDYYHRTPAIETLVRFDEKTQGPVPFLAEKVIEDSSAKTITFVLRQGIKFHDDTPFDATACKWNLEQIMTGPNTSMDFSNVSSIEVLDNYTVRVNFTAWDTTFLRLMCWDAGMVSPTAYEKNGIDYMRNNPIGTGPFKLVSFQRDTKKVFEKWDGYWQKGKPYLNSIEIDIIADPTVEIASFLAGEGDIISAVNTTDARTLQSNSKVKLLQGKVVGGLDSIFGDSANPDSPFANIKVRQAVSYAIDREAINEFVYKGFGILTNQVAPPGSLTNNPNIVGYPYDPDKAIALLKEAGYANGFDTTLWCSSSQFSQDLVTAVQGYLAAVGIKANLVILGGGQFNAMAFDTGWTNGLFYFQTVDDPEIGTPMRYYLAATSTTGISKSMMHTDDVENAIKLMIAAPDFKTKQSEAWEMQSLIFDKYCVFTPLMFYSNIAAWYTRVHDQPFESYPSNDPWSFADTWVEK